MNLVLSSHTYIPDVEAPVMPDKRIYIYGSNDNSGDTKFCSTEYRNYSSKDLIHWRDHGIIFDSVEAKYGLNNKLTLGPPDCIAYHNKYYTCGASL